MDNAVIESTINSMSVLANPFTKDCVTRITTDCGEAWFREPDDPWYFRGTVYFSNGNTKGEQKFEGNDMADLTAKMAAFLNELDK